MPATDLTASPFTQEPTGSPPQPDWIWRRVFRDDGTLLRSGWADPAVPLTRNALLSWWASEDERQAEAAALEAEQQAAMDQAPAEGAMALAAVSLALGSTDAEVAALREEQERLSATVADLVMATPEEVLRGTALLSNVSGLAGELDAKQRELLASIDARLAELDARLAELTDQQRASITKVGQAVTDARQLAETATTAVAAKVQRDVATLLSTTSGLLSEMRGPVGPEGMAGAGISVIAGMPEGVDATVEPLGRPAIRGDVLIDGTAETRTAWRWNGQQWQRGPAFRSIDYRDVKISALDASTKTFPTQVIQAPLGGGGSERLLARTTSAGAGSSILISDSSRWSIPLRGQFGAPSPSAARVALEITAADGGNAGAKLFVTADVLLGRSGNSESVVYALLGELSHGMLDVSLELQRRNSPTLPGGVTIAIPPNTDSVQLWMTVVSNGSTCTTALLSGGVEWLMPEEAHPHLQGSGAGNLLIPAWEL